MPVNDRWHSMSSTSDLYSRNVNLMYDQAWLLEELNVLCVAKVPWVFGAVAHGKPLAAAVVCSGIS